MIISLIVFLPWYVYVDTAVYISPVMTLWGAGCSGMRVLVTLKQLVVPVDDVNTHIPVLV